MSDNVGFEPNRLDQLSKKLQSVAQVLDGNLQQISSIIASVGGSVSGASKIGYWVSEAHNDANDMSYRSQRAWQLYRQQNKNPFFVGPRSGVVDINWVETSQGGRQAAQDAHDFGSAINDPNTPQSRQQLKSLAKKLRDHVNDKDYTSTLWNTLSDPGLAARLARVLHDQDVRQNADMTGNRDAPYPQILSGESKKILADVAASLAAASKQPQALPQGVRDKLTKPDHGDLWSSSMLFKYGPHGKAWDKSLLANMARSIYDWRGPSRPVPGNSPTASGPGWWKTLLPQGPGAADFVDPKVLQEVDPTCAILDRLSESPGAARDFMTGKNGGKYTDLLVGTPPWITGSDGKQIDLSGRAGNVIKAATHIAASDNDIGAQAAKWAMLNTILAANKFKNVGPGGGLVKMPPALRHAITSASLEHIPDLALSAKFDPDNGVDHFGGDSNSPLEIRVSKADLESFLKVTLTDSHDIGEFHGAVLAYLRIAVADGSVNASSPTIDAAAQLDGLLRKSTSLRALEKARSKDLAIGILKSLAAPGFEKVGKAIVPKREGFAGDTQDAAVGIARDKAQSLIFPEFEGKARGENDVKYQRELSLLEQVAAEGLISAGQLPDPFDERISKPTANAPVTFSASFWVDGHIQLVTARQRRDWIGYAERHAGSYEGMLTRLRSGFDVQTVARQGGGTG
jgi:hypothetical protein